MEGEISAFRWRFFGLESIFCGSRANRACFVAVSDSFFVAPNPTYIFYYSIFAYIYPANFYEVELLLTPIVDSDYFRVCTGPVKEASGKLGPLYRRRLFSAALRIYDPYGVMAFVAKDSLDMDFYSELLFSRCYLNMQDSIRGVAAWKYLPKMGRFSELWISSFFFLAEVLSFLTAYFCLLKWWHSSIRLSMVVWGSSLRGFCFRGIFGSCFSSEN